MIDKNLLYNNNQTIYLTSNSAGAPQLQNKYGSLVELLNLVLCEGINFKEASRLEVIGSELKVHLTVDHRFVKHQVITITGAEEEECNGNFRVKRSDSLYIIVQLKSEVSFTEATTLSKFDIKTSPLGFKRVYNNAANSTMCFKNNSLHSPAILKVIDELPPSYGTNYAKFARVVMGSHIDSSGNFINNNKMPFHPDYPDAENTGAKNTGTSGTYGFAKWDYATNTDPYIREHVGVSNVFPRSWSIIGDSKSFYLIVDSTGTGYPTILGFGTFKSYNPAESYNIFLQARDGFVPTHDTSNHGYARTRNYFGYMGNTLGGFLLANAYGGGNFTTLRYRSGGLFFGNSNKEFPSRTDRVKNFNPQAGVMVTSNITITDEDTFVIRGHHRGIKAFYGVPSITSNTISEEGHLILEINDNSSSQYRVPYLFSMLDWED